MDAPRVSDKNRYVRRVLLNGEELDRLYLTHEEIMKGGKLEFEMSNKPCKKKWKKPYSLSTEQ